MVNQVLSICDIVLNHTANESPWLLEHPEATYNVYNCPHLKPAFLLDAVLAKLTEDVGRGDYESWGIPSKVNQTQHLDVIFFDMLSIYFKMNSLLTDTVDRPLKICY